MGDNSLLNLIPSSVELPTCARRIAIMPEMIHARFSLQDKHAKNLDGEDVQKVG